MQFVCMPILISLAVMVLQGCSSSIPAIKLDPKVEYKYVGKVCDQSPGSKGKCFNGVGVLHARKRYELKMFATRADLVKIRTCNRTRQLLHEGGSFVFKMTPNQVERNLIHCQINAQAYDYKKELHSFYWIIMERLGFELPVETQCDGYIVGPDQGAPPGVGGCQVGSGMDGLIKFKMKTKVFNKTEICPFKFTYAPGKSITTGRDFYFSPGPDVKGAKYMCEFLEQVHPFRKALVGIHVFEEEIFPKENK